MGYGYNYLCDSYKNLKIGPQSHTLLKQYKAQSEQEWTFVKVFFNAQQLTERTIEVGERNKIL